MQTVADILFEEMAGQGGHLGVITLNRPHALNALNQVMIRALDQQLVCWAKDTNIKAVVIRAAEGRAFCAGGDIRAIYDKRLAGDSTLASFFSDEYHLNQRIFHFPKPYIALLDGITMGGGAGISLHGSHRVATERVLFAMPETAIGFHPDVGASYFLGRLAHKMGLYLGLTGARIFHTDCLALGLIDAVVPQGALSQLIQALADTHLPDKAAVTKVIAKFMINPPPSGLLQSQDKIEKYFSATSVEAILQNLENAQDEWCKQTAIVLKTKSPTSLKVAFHEINHGRGLSFDECMQMEYRVTMRFVEGPDFFEGIRAAVVDKDHKPLWQPAMLQDVTVKAVANYFAPLIKELV